MGVAYTELFPGVGGSKMSEWELSEGGVTVRRPNYIVAGHAEAAVVEPLNSSPSGSEYGLIVRNIPSGTQTIKYQLPATSALASASVNCASAGDNTLIAAVGGQTTRIHRIWMVFGGSCTWYFKCGAAAQSGAVPATTGGSFTLDLDSEPWFLTGVNEVFAINLSSAVQCSGRVYYVTSA